MQGLKWVYSTLLRASLVGHFTMPSSTEIASITKHREFSLLHSVSLSFLKGFLVLFQGIMSKTKALATL